MPNLREKFWLDARYAQVRFSAPQPTIPYGTMQNLRAWNGADISAACCRKSQVSPTRDRETVFFDAKPSAESLFADILAMAGGERRRIHQKRWL